MNTNHAWRYLLLSVAALALSNPCSALHAQELFTVRHEGWVSSVASDSFGRVFFATSSDGKLGIWNWASGSKVSMINVKEDQEVVSFVAISPDTWTFATGGYDGEVSTWVYETQKSRLHPGEETPRERSDAVRSLQSRLRSYRGAVTCGSFRVNNYVLATGSIDGTVKLWNAQRGSEITTLRGHKSWVNSVDFCEIEEFKVKRGSLLASGSSDGTVKLWFHGPGNEEKRTLERTLDVSNTEVRCVKFSPDFLLAVGLRYGDVQLWDAEKGERKLAFKAHEGDCWAVKFSPDGKTLITGGGDWGKPGEVKLWDVTTGELRATLKHTGEVLCVAVSPDGRRLAAGAGDKTVKVWDTEKLIGFPKKEKE